MPPIAFTAFATPIGTCGIAWSEEGIVGVQLPEGDETRTLARLRRRFPEGAHHPPNTQVEAAIASITALLAGRRTGLGDIALDLRGVPPFNVRVYHVTRGIEPGTTLTYGEVAHQLGDPTLAKAVGQALSQNPIPLVVPCHRVLAAHGLLGGFTAPGGVETKRRLLAIEGAAVASQMALFD